jgi:ankyrin repeat protein
MRLILGALVIGLLFSGCGMPAPGTPLAQAAAAGDAGRVRELASGGAEPDAHDEHGLTAMIHAARNGHAAAVQALLDAGASPDRPDRFVNGWTPLMHAVHKGQYGAAALLLVSGADVDARAWGGVTALVLASADPGDDIVRLLLDHGADPHARADSGATPLINALAGGHEANVRALLARDPALRLGDNLEARMAVMIAHVRGRSDLVDLVRERNP